MTLHQGIGIGAAVALAVAVWVAVMGGQPQSANQSVSNSEDQAIRTVIADLGAKLKNVSVQSPSAPSDIAREYSAFVTPELLAKWQAAPQDAPGRLTSSPWPDRIEVGSVSYKEVSATAKGNVVEVANTDVPGAFAAMYPVTITLEKRDGKWLVSDWQEDSMQEPPERVTVVGYWECLPHKNTSGPQTMECALGIAIDQSDGHYAINTSLMSTYPVGFQTGQKVRISGPLVPPEPTTKYDIDGTIWATTIEPL